MLNTKPGIANAFRKDLKRKGAGSAINKAMVSNPNNIHHFSHQNGYIMVANMEIPANKTIRIERGIRAC
jgi:hypothetical protein